LDDKKYLTFKGSAPLGIDLNSRVFPEGSIYDAFSKIGFQITDNEDADFCVFINHSAKEYLKCLKRGFSVKNLALIRTEPKCVFPSQYRSNVEKKYGLVVSPGLIVVGRTFESEFKWPYTYESDPNKPYRSNQTLKAVLSKLAPFDQAEYERWLSREIPISMVVSNKVSPVSDSNYGIRRELAEAFTPEELQVYGTLWDSPMYPKLKFRLGTILFSIRNRYMPNLISIYGGLHKNFQTSKGYVQDKHSIMRNSKFSLIVENSNYGLSARLFDCLIDGSIPIFFGPRLKDAGIPSDIAFEWKNEIKDLPEFLGNISEDAIFETLSKGREFILSSHFSDNWDSSKVNRAISLHIKNHWALSENIS
jgi:hypothetical protein